MMHRKVIKEQDQLANSGYTLFTSYLRSTLLMELGHQVNILLWGACE